MGLKLEVGKFYKTRDGRKVGPMLIWNEEAEFPFSDHMTCGTSVWAPDGSDNGSRSEIIAEWPADDAPTGPVRTVTRTTREIVPGEYDGLDVGRAVNGMVFLAMPIANHCQKSIDAIIANLTAIRDALEEQA